MAYSPEGKRIAVATIEGRVLILDKTNGQVLRELYPHNGVVRAVRFSPDGRTLATAGIDGLVKLWDARINGDVDRIDMRLATEHGAFARHNITPDGRHLLLPVGFNHGWHGSGINVLMTYDLTTRISKMFKGHTKFLTDAIADTDGKRYASSSVDKTVRIWDARRGTQLHQINHPDEVTRLGYVFGSPYFVTACADGVLRVCEWSSGSVVRQWDTGSERIEGLDVSDDGRLIVSCGNSKFASVWDLTNGQLIKKLDGHEGNVTAVCFNHGSSQIATGSDDTTIKFWNLATGQSTQTLKGHTRSILDVDFSTDDKRLASCGQDLMQKLWDVDSGEEALSLRDTGVVRSVAFHPDGQRLFSVQNWFILIQETVRRELPTLEASFQQTNLYWHAEQAASAQNNGQAYARRFHLEQVVAIEPRETVLRKMRANSHAELGRFREAAQDYEKCAQAGPLAPSDGNHHALTRLALGDIRAYRQISQNIANQIQPTDQVSSINNCVWSCLLVPGRPDNADKLQELMDAARARPQEATGILATVLDNTQAWLYFRCNRLTEARECAMRSIKAHNWPEDWLVMALIEIRDGRLPEARQALDKARSAIKDKVSINRRTYYLRHWSILMTREILTQEVVRAIERAEGLTLKKVVGTASYLVPSLRAIYTNLPSRLRSISIRPIWHVKLSE